MSKSFFWDEPFLYKNYDDQMLRRCLDHLEARLILTTCHNVPYGGHFRGTIIDAKVLQSGYLWSSLLKYVNELVKACDKSKRLGNISMRPKMPLANILEIELFGVWGIDFMRPFP